MKDFKFVKIGEIKNLLNDYEIEVDSPDGWVKISEFVDKGNFRYYKLFCNDKTITSNADHLYETKFGWLKVIDILKLQEKGIEVEILCDDGFYHPGYIVDLHEEGEIVDIRVDHENHRYYTDGISSHNTGTGKSIFLCDIAKNYLEQGLNVLYVTAEMAESEIAQRIDANVLNLNQEQLPAINVKENMQRILKIKEQGKGSLIIKEFPTSSATALDIKKVIDDLQLKKKIDVNVMIVDYINIFNSYRYTSKNSNMYTTAKSVAEELRGLAVRYKIPIWTATQQNRSTYGADDVGLNNTSESMGVPNTLDLFLALISTEELSKKNQIMVKQLKNRYGDVNINTRFLLGLDKGKARFFDTTNSEYVPEASVDLSEKFKENYNQKTDDLSDFSF